MIDSVQEEDSPKRDRGDYFKVYHAANRDRISARKRGRYSVRKEETREDRNAASRAWYKENRARVVPERKTRRLQNIEEANRKARAYRLKRRDVENKRNRSYYVGHKAACNAATKDWYDRNKEAVSVKRRAYRLANEDKIRKMRRRYRARRRATPKGALDERMSCAVWRALRSKKSGRKWETLVGYTLDDLQRRIESQFGPRMNWERLLAGEIEIDHIIPIVKFTYSTAEDPQFKRCWALENLQPKWKPDNRSKNDRLEKHEQIPLGI